MALPNLTTLSYEALEPTSSCDDWTVDRKRCSDKDLAHFKDRAYTLKELIAELNKLGNALQFQHRLVRYQKITLQDYSGDTKCTMHEDEYFYLQYIPESREWQSFRAGKKLKKQSQDARMSLSLDTADNLSREYVCEFAHKVLSIRPSELPVFTESDKRFDMIFLPDDAMQRMLYMTLMLKESGAWSV